ncbi:MAG: hypothetical protein U1E78_10115 [Gammaproteobacteria bacterium]
MTLSNESDYLNKNGIVLNPSGLYRRYRIALLWFAVVCLWQVFHVYTIIFLPVLIWASINCLRTKVNMTIYPSVSEWGLGFGKGVYHRFNILQAWFATGCIILTIQSKTYRSERLLLLRDQMHPLQFKYLVFEVKKKLFIQD